MAERLLRAPVRLRAWLAAAPEGPSVGAVCLHPRVGKQERAGQKGDHGEPADPGSNPDAAIHKVTEEAAAVVTEHAPGRLAQPGSP